MNLQVALVFWKMLNKAILRKTDFEIAVDVALTQRRCAAEEKGDTSRRNTLKAIAVDVLQQGNRWYQNSRSISHKRRERRAVKQKRREAAAKRTEQLQTRKAKRC